MKNKIIIIALLVVFLAPLPALAQANPCSRQAVDSAADKDSTLPACINQIYRWSLGIGALLALLMVVLGGYNYMTSAGNAEQAAKGTEMIWGAIIGLILLFSAYLILRTINPDLVNFNLNTEQLDPTQTNTPSSPNEGGIRQ